MRSAILHSTTLLDLWLPTLIEQRRIPGLAIGITHKEKLVYTRGLGMANVESKEKMTPEHVFRIASISKTITAIAILQLQEQGKLQLDDAVRTYLPWVKGEASKHRDAAKITIRQLLTHESGIAREGRFSYWADDQFPSRTELKKVFATRDLILEHGTQYKYSNFGYALLGELIRTVSGVSYEGYVQKNIFDALSLKSTSPDYDAALLYAQGYERNIAGQDRQPEPNPSAHAFASATGVSSTVEDLAQIVMALRFDNEALLKRDSLKELQRPQSFTENDADLYGLGIDLYEVDGNRIRGHSGSYPGYSTEFALDQKNELGVVVMVNQTAGSAEAIAIGVLEVLYRMKSKGYADGKPIELSKAINGLYRSRWSDTVVMGVHDGAIVINPRHFSPMDHVMYLKKTGAAAFRIETASNNHSIGESATFTIPNNAKRATKLIFGATPSERVR